VSIVDCSGSVLAFMQLVLQDLCQHVVLALYMIYYDHKKMPTSWTTPLLPSGTTQKGMIQVTTAEPTSIISSENLIPDQSIHSVESDLFNQRDLKNIQKDFKNSRMWCYVQLCFEIIVFALLFLFVFYLGLDSEILYYFGIVMMIISSILQFLATGPQILETYYLKDWGSMSVISLIIQTFGSFLVAVNLAPHGSWEIWTPYLVICVMQLVLLLEGTYFSCRRRWK